MGSGEGDGRMTPAIYMERISKWFRGRVALEAVTWSVAAGSFHGLVGANGAGKTTLLRLALGVIWPDDGQIEVFGERLGHDNAEIRQRVHYVASGRPPGASGFRVAEWMRYASLLYRRWDAGRAQQLLEAIELDSGQFIGHLSSGQMTSLALAVAVASRPDLLLLDEPTNGLDLVVKRQMLQLIIDMAASEGTTVVMATHNLEDVERLADSLALLYRGRLVAAGGLDEIKGRMHRIQVALPGQWPEAVFQDPSITHVERRGQVALLTVEGPAEPIMERLRTAGAVVVEPIPMDLSEVFRSMLEKEGYTRETITWDRG
jgi:ABC-2 type transport system ATP-binding protein